MMLAKEPMINIFLEVYDIPDFLKAFKDLAKTLKRTRTYLWDRGSSKISASGI